MGLGQGYRAVMGIGKEAGAYGTAAAVRATDLVPFESESLEKSFARIRGEVLRGEAGRRADDRGNQTVSGSVPSLLMYDRQNGSNCFGSDLLLALGMGSAAHSAGVTTMSLTDRSTGIFTLSIDKDVSVWQFNNGKVGGFRLRGSESAPAAAEFDLVFYDLTRGSTLANTSTTLAALKTQFGDPAYLRHRDLTLRIGDLTDALSGGDVVPVSEWELALDNGLAAGDYGSGRPQPLEPARGGFREVTFSVTVPRYENDNFFNWLDNDTALQADLTYANSTNQFIIELHTLRLTGFGAPVAGPGMVRQRVDFTAFIKSTGNSHMSGSNEFVIKTKNQRTAAPI